MRWLSALIKKGFHSQRPRQKAMCKNVTQPLTHRGQAAAQNQGRKFKKRFKHVSSLAFFSSLLFLHIFVVVVALLNLRPKDTISIWGACESLAPAPRLHFISLCFVARRFNFRLNAKQKVSLWPERKVALHVDMSWLGAGQARHKTKDTAIHLAGWLPENGHGATFSTWLIFTI